MADIIYAIRMENVYSVKPIQTDKLPPISSLLSIKVKKLPQSTDSPPTVTSPKVKCQKASTVLIQPKQECNKPSFTPKSVKILNSPTAVKSTLQPVSSPPPPPHILCGVGSNVQNFQQSPTQVQSVNKRGTPSPEGMAPYLSRGFLDPNSFGTTNIPCSPRFPFQQTNFGEMNTVACQTIIYQNTSFISPKSGFRSSICNHPSACRRNVSNFSDHKNQSSPRSKMTSHSQSSWIQAPIRPTDCMPRQACSQQIVRCSQNPHITDGTGRVISMGIDRQGISSVSLVGQMTNRSSQIYKDGCKSSENSNKKGDEDGAGCSVPMKKPIFPVYSSLHSDVNQSSLHSGTMKYSDSKRLDFGVPESSEFNLFPHSKIEEIERVGSNDLSVDDAEYHPIALPLGCYQFNDSDTESDTTSHEGSLSRHMAKMGQDKFDLHLDKTSTFMEWKLIPIKMNTTNKMSDDAKCSKCPQVQDPRLQKLLDENQISKEKCIGILTQPMDKNQGSNEGCMDSTSFGPIVPGKMELEQQKELTVVGSEHILCQDKNQVSDDGLPVSSSQNKLCEVSEIDNMSQSTENEYDTQHREKETSFMEIEKRTKLFSKPEVSIVSNSPLVKPSGGDVCEDSHAVSTINTLTSDVLLPSSEGSAEHQSRRSSFSDSTDTATETHADNPLARIATVLSQNLSKSSKDKVGKNVERLSQNISNVMQKVKGSPENITASPVENNVEKHGTCVAGRTSDSIAKIQVKNNILINTTHHKEANVSSSRVLAAEKKELPPLWQDSKCSGDNLSEKVNVSHKEKRLLRESADFLGEDFSSFSRRSQRKRGVPKKLENYLSECREAPDNIQTPVNKQKRQKQEKESDERFSTSDVEDNDSDWNMVELYRDDILVEEPKKMATTSEVETTSKSKGSFEKVAKERYPDIDEEFPLKSTPCTRNMLKRLTTSHDTGLNRPRKTVARSPEKLPVSTTAEGKDSIVNNDTHIPARDDAEENDTAVKNDTASTTKLKSGRNDTAFTTKLKSGKNDTAFTKKLKSGKKSEENDSSPAKKNKNKKATSSTVKNLKKTSNIEKKKKEKANESLLKHSAKSNKADTLRQNSAEKETSRKKKLTKAEISRQKSCDEKETPKKKKNSLKNSSNSQMIKPSKKQKNDSFPSRSKYKMKLIDNLIMKNKQRILKGYAKFRVITDPYQGAELMSNRPVECRFCKKTTTFSTVKDHERSHKFKCIRCCLIFNNQKEKNEHLSKQHNTTKKHGKVPQVPKVNELYHCMLCERSWSSIKTFQRHLQSNLHGYNRHIQNRCLSRLGSHIQQSSQTLQGQETLRAIDNGAKKDDQQTQKETKDKPFKMWTLPENETSIEELNKQLVKTVRTSDGREEINYYYDEPEFLQLMKEQECILQKMSTPSKSDRRQRAETYAVLTNFSMMNYITSAPKCPSIQYIPEEQDEKIQYYGPTNDNTHDMHADPAGVSTNSNNTTGCSTNYPCDGTGMSSAINLVSASIPEEEPQYVPNGGSMVYSTLGTSNIDSYHTDSSKNATQFAVPFTYGQSADYDESSLVSSQSNIMDNNYQHTTEPSQLDQPTLDTSRNLSTSSSDNFDMDQGQLGWLSRAIQDIEADPFYQDPNFLDRQFDLDNDSGFNKHPVSQDSSVFLSPLATSESAVTIHTRNYTDLDNGQQIQVCDQRGLHTDKNSSVDTENSVSVLCPDRHSHENSGAHSSDTLYSDTVPTPKQCCGSQRIDEFNEDSTESQEPLKLEYAQILCDIRNDVLGTRSYQE